MYLGDSKNCDRLILVHAYAGFSQILDIQLETIDRNIKNIECE